MARAPFPSINVSFENDKLNQNSSDNARELLTSIHQRSTYRGFFQPSRLEDWQRELLTKSAKPQTSISVVSNGNVQGDFISFLKSCELYMWFQGRAFIEFLRSVRFGEKKPTIDEPGLATNQLGVKAHDLFFLQILKIVPWLAQILIRIPGLNFPIVSGVKKRLKNSHYLLITSDTLESENIIAAGQSAMAAWLELERMGYKAQPMSSASITLLDAENDALPADTLPKFKKIFYTEGPEIIRKQFHLSTSNQGAHIIWLLRFGKPNS